MTLNSSVIEAGHYIREFFLHFLEVRTNKNFTFSRDATAKKGLIIYGLSETIATFLRLKITKLCFRNQFTTFDFWSYTKKSKYPDKLSVDIS